VKRKKNKTSRKESENGTIVELERRMSACFWYYRFKGLWNCEPELIELFFSRICIVGGGSWFLTERMAEMARVMSVRSSAEAAPMAV
jgi:hypothetical protein